jgi:sterol desaturase/sphingolipid hydroxylase (fatty acid hydroxylase superfamily)
MDIAASQLAETGAWYPFSEAVLFAFTLLVVAELAVDALRGRPDRDWWETASNVMIAVPNTVISATLAPAVAAVGLSAVGRLAPWSIPLTAWSWALALVLADLSYYAGHRLDHRVRALWAHHSVHHSSTDYDLSTSTRIAWHDGLITWIYAIPMAMLGFHPGQILVANLLVLVYQTWIHTRRIDRMPAWFEAVFNTPSHHRVHHGSNPAYLDCNYGGVLIIWDRLFGTFVAEDEPVRFGLTTPINTIHPLRVNFGAYLSLAADLRRARTGREAVVALFGPPEAKIGG